MKLCQKTLIQVEEMRKEVCFSWGLLLCQSGAIVLRRPNFLSCYLGLLYQTSRDINIEFNKIFTFNIKIPLVEIIKPEGDLSDIESTKDCINNFAITAKNLTPLGEKLKHRLENIFNLIARSISTWLENFKEVSGGFKQL